MSRSRKKGFNKNDMDEAFDAFLKESISSEESSIDTARIMKYLDPKKNKNKNDNTWWMEHVDEEDEDLAGLTATGSKFLKKKPEPAKDTKPTQKSVEKSVSFSQEVRISRDSLDDESLGVRQTADRHRESIPVPALSLGSSHSMTDDVSVPQHRSDGPGKETLDEIADKERFFKELEKNSNDTLDYSRLNKDLDGSTTLAVTLDNIEQYGNGRLQPDNSQSPQLTTKMTSQRGEDPQQNKDSGSKTSAEKKETDMLSKVALLDSLDSTLGTKVAGSRETKGSDDLTPGHQDMHIDDNDGKHEEVKRAHFEAAAGHTEDDTEGNKAMDSRGITLKTTATGLCYTDTSREFEALHSAMRHQVGMETLDDTKDFTFKDTSTNQTQEITEADGTGGFGLKPVALPRHDKSRRTADDILREVQELTGHSADGNTGRKLYTLNEDNFDGRESEVSPVQRTLLQDNDVNLSASDGYDISPLEKAGKQKVKFLPNNHGSDKYQMSPDRSRSEVRGQGYDSSDTSVAVGAKKSQKDKGEKRSKFKSIRSSGYGQRTPSPKRSNAKTSQKSWNPSHIQKHKIKGSDSAAQVKRELAVKSKSHEPQVAKSPLADNHLVQSVQSFASYIQEQFASFTPNDAELTNRGETLSADVSSSRQKMAALDREHKLVREVQEWQDQWKEERRMLSKIKAEMAAVERDYRNRLEQMRIDHEQELFKLKQENYVLSAKLAEDEHSKNRLAVNLDSLDGATKEQVALLEKEVREQEHLLASYQQENERLYQETKKIQQESKLIQEKMFKENQKLSTELAKLREELSIKEQQLKNKGIITAPSVQQQLPPGSAVLGAGRITQLEAQLKQAKSRESTLKQEIDTLKQAKQELEDYIDELVQKMDQLESKLKDPIYSEAQQTKGNLLKYEKEIDRLKNKLRWYIENQELLDKDAAKLREKDEEIRKLKLKVESLQNETGKKQTEVRLKTKERAQDAKRIQDLERQVKEMETILRKRHPNSIPVLMWAASTAGDGNEHKAPSVVYLEKRILKLERELEEKDEEAKKSLRAVEQKYNMMKLQYEERIQSLEQQLSHDQLSHDHPHTHAVALQRELESTKERYKKRTAELEAELEKVKRELVTAKNKESAARAAENRLKKEAESELGLRVKALQLEVANQEREKQQLQKVIDRLQKEKNQLAIDITRSMSDVTKAQGERLHNKLQSKTKVLSKGNKKSTTPEVEPLPEVTPLPTYADGQNNDKQYEPMTFAGRHVTEILKENDELRQKVEMLELEVEQQKVKSHKLLAEYEAMTRKNHEDMDEKIAALHAAHQAEVQKLLSERVMQQSTSKIAELQNKLDTQEVMLKHLRDQLAQNSVDRERLSMLAIREATLEAKIKQLTDELHDAKQTHTPEMKHFLSLQDKIRDMEIRHAQRERELQSIIQHSHAMAHADVAEEINKWRRLVDSKNHELERFRIELDSILDVLKELQRQGVVLPSKGSSLAPSSSR